MKVETLTINEFKNTKRGQLRTEHSTTGSGRSRIVRCIGFEKDSLGKIYAHWQYVLKSTLKPSGKSSSFITEL